MTKVSFCGASGNGISPLAQILIKKGFEVFASDRSFDNGLDGKIKKALLETGMNIKPQDGSCICDDLSCLYVSAAIDEANPDVKAAREKNIPIKKRSDLLAEIFHQYSRNIAIGGTSGKSTTTAMVGYVLDVLGHQPCLVNGAWLKNYEGNVGLPNYLYNEADVCVIEADESDGSITKYLPYIGVINNISHDHTSMENLMKYFNSFASNISDALVVNYDCPLASEIKHSKKTVSFSIKNNKADLFASDICSVADGILYSIDGRSFKLNLYGKFNVSNALATICVCELMGIDKFDAAKALEGFLGVKRRLEIIGTNKNGITLIDDFAHNPEKIYSAIKAVKDYEGRVIVMYQPHSAFSVENTGKEVAEKIALALGDEDVFIMPEIYMLSADDGDITAKNIVDNVILSGHNHSLFIKDRADITSFLQKNVRQGDRVIIMGARDNSLPDYSIELLDIL